MASSTSVLRTLAGALHASRFRIRRPPEALLLPNSPDYIELVYVMRLVGNNCRPN